MNWLTKHLVDDCKQWWKLSSVWLAGIAGAFSFVVVEYQSFALQLLNYIPNGPMRTVVAFLFGIAVIIIPTITRLWKQKPPDAPTA